MGVFRLAAALCLAPALAAAQTTAPAAFVPPPSSGQAPSVQGQATAPPGAPAAEAAGSSAAGQAAAATCCTLPVGSIIVVELAEPLSSRTQEAGYKFKIRVAEPVLIGSTEVLSVGDEGMGEVIDAARPGMGGRGGKLVLAARYVDHRGIRVPLRAFRLGGAGHGRAIESLAVTEAVGIIGLAVEGDQLEYPAGARATAKIAALVDLSPPSGAAPAPATPAVPPTSQ